MPLNGQTDRIGIIAGGGQFPILFLRAAVKKGYKVAVTAIENEADPILEKDAHAFRWFKVGQMGKIIDTFKESGVDQAVMIGTITKTSLFDGSLKLDLKAIKMFAKRFNHLDDHLLRQVAFALEDEGITIRESTLFLPELLIPTGQLSKRKPNKRERKDIEWGFEMAKNIGQFDIGQCIVVRSKIVVAVEAIEGTDETIKRGGEYGRGRAVVIKVAKPNQDLRFDLPSVGVTTIKNMAASGCTCLAVEAGRTLCFDRQKMLELADQHNICVTAMEYKK